MYRGQFAKDLPNRNPNDELSLRIRRGDRGRGVHLGDAVDPQALLIFEVDEQHPDVCILGGIAHREIHAVAVVVRKYQRHLIEYAHESGIAAFVGAVRMTEGVRGRQEEHIHALDECAILVGQLLAKQALLDPVRQSFGVELALQAALAFPKQLGHMGSPGACQNLTY